MYVDAGNTTFVFLTMASTISAVQKPRAQQFGPVSPFFRLSSASLYTYKTTQTYVFYYPSQQQRFSVRKRPTILTTDILFTATEMSRHFSGSSASPILAFMSRIFVPATLTLDHMETVCKTADV